MHYINIIGLVTSAMGGFSLFPQLLKVLRTKFAKAIFLGTISIFSGRNFFGSFKKFC
jgi:uncharacterized protein with PQ loop repeat